MMSERVPPQAEPPKPQEDLSTYCPNCSAKLKESRCKLVCKQCGFFLSCADFY